MTEEEYKIKFRSLMDACGDLQGSPWDERFPKLLDEHGFKLDPQPIPAFCLRAPTPEVIGAYPEWYIVPK